MCLGRKAELFIKIPIFLFTRKKQFNEVYRTVQELRAQAFAEHSSGKFTKISK